MSQLYGFPELDEADEAYEDAIDEADESYEEAAPRRRPPVQTAPRGSAYRPRPNQSYVTQAQLQAALARVNSQMSTNSNAIKTLDGRVRAGAAEQARLTAAVRKEVADRKKDTETLRKEIESTKELAVLLPLIAPGNPLIGLLALGSGGGGGLFGGTGGDGTSNMLMLALVLGPLLAPKK